MDAVVRGEEQSTVYVSELVGLGIPSWVDVLPQGLKLLSDKTN
jgi:hypothetical protein